MNGQFFRVEIIDKDSRVPILKIRGLQLSDNGIYMCKIGERQTSCVLHVEEGMTII